MYYLDCDMLSFCYQVDRIGIDLLLYMSNTVNNVNVYTLYKDTSF